MSIFKSTFSPFVKSQLDVRQKAMTDRTPQNLQYLNSRNAWVRMSSSVNVNGTNDLAKKYILQGGTLNVNSKDLNGVLKKEGIGNFNKAYSNKSQTGIQYQRGIRPMPGIISADIKSKTAYGSLREVVVNFQCWDIQQLEDLEVLYMRPGYTVLVEWGWTPYLNNKGEYEPNFTDYYDIINSPSQDRTALFKALYDKSIKYGGNYDAMFGYVKNYQWSANPDGGYDCQTTIITTGEIIESLKINYLPPINLNNASGDDFIQYIKTNPFFLPGDYEKSRANNNVGLLKDEFTGNGNSQDKWGLSYEKNILAGMWAETYYKIKLDVAGKVINYNTSPSSSFVMNGGGGAIATNIPILQTIGSDNSLANGSGNLQVYITIGAMFELLNKYIIAKGSDGQPLVRLSVKQNEYDGTSTAGDYLLCTAHPLQVSVDPSICLIKSPLWANGEIINTVTASLVANTDVRDADIAYDLLQKGANIQRTFTQDYGTNEKALIEGFEKITNVNIYNLIEAKIKESPVISYTGVNIFGTNSKYNTLQDILNGELEEDNLDVANTIKNSLSIAKIQLNFQTGTRLREPFDSYLITNTFSITPPASNTDIAEAQNIIVEKSQNALQNLQFLKDLPLDYFYNGETKTEIGVIKNIYVNVDYLYQRALDTSLESSDSKGKNEINLYSYLKKVISDIQSAIGNVSDFEIHVDPVDNNVARIIDVNYTEPTKGIYEDLFQLQVHNLNSVVRSYSLQSQIFPNQSSIIAIGSQAKGGQLGMQTNTFIDFNRNLTDRIITEKLDGIGSKIKYNVNDRSTNVTNGCLSKIIKDFDAFNNSSVDPDDKADSATLFSDAKNSLRDLIVYFQSLTEIPSPGSNRNLIPTKFSAEMDGIGGLVIGHMFRLPDNVMPRGYRGEGYGSKLGNAITSINHTISNGDWVTKIDTLNIVLDDSVSGFYKIDILKLIEKTTSEALLPPPTADIKIPITNEAVIAGFGKVDNNSVPRWAAAILDLIAYTEGTAKRGYNNGYDVIVGRNNFIEGWDANYTSPHPNKLITLSSTLKSTAAGRYQFLFDIWKGYVNSGLSTPFNQKNQDTAAFKLVNERVKDNDGQNSYNLAVKGVTNVNQNQPFLNMLGKSFLYKNEKDITVKGNKNLAGGWASILDRDGEYVYPGQGPRNVSLQSLYDIYLKAVEKNK